MSPSTNISVITPCKNPGTLLDSTVKSVVNNQNSMSGKLVQLVIQDSESVDGTVEKLQRWEGEFGIIYRSEVDRSMTEAMNKAIRLSSGAIIGQLNAGDLYLPGALKIVNTFFATHDVDICFFGGIASHEKWDIVHIPKYMRNEFCMTLFDCQAYSCSVFYTRQLYESLGGFNEEFPLAQDVDFYARAMRKGAKIGISNEIISRFLVRDGQLGVKYLKEQKEEAARALHHPKLYKLARRLPIGAVLYLSGGVRFTSARIMAQYFSYRLPSFLKS